MAKRKKSKITVPNDGQTKAKLEAFRPPKDISRRLQRAHDKSEVIVEALRLYYSAECEQPCPTCRGSGKIMRVKT